MMRTLLHVFKIIIIYTFFFIEFIDNEKEEGNGEMMICTPYMSNYYLCDCL
jgi:hypothetical protein